MRRLVALLLGLSLPAWSNEPPTRAPPAAHRLQEYAAFNAQPASEELCRTRRGVPVAAVEREQAKCARLPPVPRERCIKAIEAHSSGLCSQLVAQRAVRFDGDLHTLQNWAQLDAVFEAAHPSRFVFLAADVEGPRRTVKRGEVALVFEHATRGETATLVTPDREFLEVKAELVSGTRLAGAPMSTVTAATVTVLQQARSGAPFVACSAIDEDVSEFPLGHEDALLGLLEPADPRFVQLTRINQAFQACFDGQLQKLDPDSRAGSYDLVTTDRASGKVVKVEGFAEVVQRKACAACKCGAARQQRRAVVRELCKAPREAELTRVKKLVARLDAAGP